MANFQEIKQKFSQLSDQEKMELLKKMYDFSKGMRLFLKGQLLGENSADEFIVQMERETVDQIYKRKGVPGTPNGRVVNSIINKARKSNVSIKTLLKLEQLAYRGFIEFLNEFGGGPDSFMEMGPKHLENYLLLIKKNIADRSEQQRLFEQVRQYLLGKDNMITDEVDEIFEHITGIAVERKR